MDRNTIPNKQTNRQTGPELLRIIAMLLIVFHHYAYHSGIDYSSFSRNNLFLTIIESGGKIGVIIFVLITGYFSCCSKFSVKRIVKLLLAVEFYSITLMVAAILVNAQPLSKSILLKGCFPLIYGDGYWFISIYIILYIISPILNAAINHVSKKNLAFIILFLITIYCVVPNTLGLIKQTNDYGLSNVVWFILIYLIGAYFRKYSFICFRHTKLSVVLLLISIIVMLSSKTLLLRVGDGINNWLKKSISVFANSDLYAVMPLVIAILFFIVFCNLNIKASPLLFSFSKATIGVYLIHDNILFRDFLWGSIIGTEKAYQHDWFILYSIGVVIALFIICSVIDILYHRFIESNTLKISPIKRIITRIDTAIT